MRIRLVSYNIMRGGEGRADPIAEVVLGQQADVVGFHEAENDEVLQRLARRLKMEFVVGASISGRLALFSRHPIIASLNVAVIHSSSMPILDAVIRPRGESTMVAVRVAQVTHAGEADRMRDRVGARLPMVMMMSYEAPLGHRTVDGVMQASSIPVPEHTHAPVRQLDEVLVRPDMTIVKTWVEQDRLAYYASDHLPAGAEIELA